MLLHGSVDGWTEFGYCVRNPGLWSPYWPAGWDSVYEALDFVRRLHATKPC